MKCKTCQEPYHDTCPMEEGCSCCENTKEIMEDYEGYDAETFEAREKKIGSITIVKNPNFPSGTSLQAYIKTNRAELRKVFGNPNMGESGDGKSKGKQWNLVVGNHRVTIYDRREKDKKGTKYFNIGGSGKYGALLVAQALSIHRNERVYAKETVPQWLEDERRYQQVKSIDEHPDLTYERAKEYEDNRRRYGAETFDVEFNEWAEQEMMSHGKDISFKDWAEDEGMKHGDVPITEWAQHEDESHDARYGAESFEDFKRKMVGDGAVAGDVGYMEALEEFYEDYLEDFERITDEFCPEPETFEEFKERVLKDDYEMSLEAEDYQKKMYQDFLDNWDDEWEGSPPTFEEWKELVKDAEDWGGNPKGQLALALQKARENAKKPKKPLKIEKLDAETSGQWEIGEQLEEAQMNAEGKKRSGLLSDPFDELSLDSGGWKSIAIGFGVATLTLFGLTKLRK